MTSLSDDEQQLIQRDREENPGCFYSTSVSQSCRSINGDSKCELIKKIFRQCPGYRKELISNSKEVTEDERSSSSSNSERTPSDDFFTHDRMDPHTADESPFDAFFRPFHFNVNFSDNGDNNSSNETFEAQLSPFDFLRQEMLRPIEGLFGGFGVGIGNDLFDAIEREFGPQPQAPVAATRSTPPTIPPHYVFQPTPRDNASSSETASAAATSHARAQREEFGDFEEV